MDYFKLYEQFHESMERYAPWGVGKKIDEDVFIHKNYFSHIPEDVYLDAYNSLPPDFDFNVIKYNLDNQSITFIQSEDFNDSEEPLIGLSYTVTRNDNTNFSSTIDPGVLHHKWMMVEDDYSGFDTEEAKERSDLWIDSDQKYLDI